MMPSASTSARNSPGNLPIRSNLRRNTAMAATLTAPTREGGRASRMTPHRTWLVCSAVVAVAVYALLWIGSALQWNWLAAIDASALDVFYRYGTAHSGWVTAWNVFCTVLGPTAFRLVALVLI